MSIVPKSLPLDGSVEVADHAVVVNDLRITDRDVLSYFRDVPEQHLADRFLEAVKIGALGLRAMGMASDVHAVERALSRVMESTENGVNGMTNTILEALASIMDPARTSSAPAAIASTVAEAERRIAQTISMVETQVRASLDADVKTSAIARLIDAAARGEAEISRLLDPAVDGSYASKLMRHVDGYFGANGALGGVVAEAVEPVRRELLEALRELRDVAVAQAAAAAERRRSPASGDDFEDEVEAELRLLARPYGDSVERVGTLIGDMGTSKKGDFVVTVTDGIRFVVEAKDLSNPVTLKGERGILRALDKSMGNRNAAFAISVMKEQSAFPKEVGSFNVYDANKLLCTFGVDGANLEIAYRWARATVLRAAAPDGTDVEALNASLGELRKSLRELKRIESKARGVIDGADEIVRIATSQLRLANAALDDAMTAAASSGDVA